MESRAEIPRLVIGIEAPRWLKVTTVVIAIELAIVILQLAALPLAPR